MSAADEPIEGQWIPAHDAAPATIPTRLAFARSVAVQDPGQFFQPGVGAWLSVQALPFNTRRAYRADWSSFVECCERFQYRALPASHEAIETFIEWRSPGAPQDTPPEERAKFYRHVPEEALRSKPLAAAALRRAIAAIAAVHRWLGFPDPTDHEMVRATLAINVAERQLQGQKDPLRWEDLERAFAQLGEDLWAKRDRALASVAHSTLFRRSELVALTCEDYERRPTQDIGLMLIRKTKTEDPKHRKYRAVSIEAVANLETWLAAANITTGALFRGITPDGRILAAALGAGEVARIFKKIARLAGLEAARIGGHSTRIGATHDLKKHGDADVLDIMHEGGWKSPEMPKRYLEGLASQEGAMARMSRARQAKKKAT